MEALEDLLDNVQNETELEQQVIAKVENEIQLKLNELDQKQKQKLKKPKSRLEQKQQQELKMDKPPEGETQKEYLVRMGKITPMGNSAGEADQTSENESQTDHSSSESEVEDDQDNVDDGNEQLYNQRVQQWCKSRAAKRQRYLLKDPTLPSTFDHDEEYHRPLFKYKDKSLGSNFNVPGEIYHKLFDYQKTSLRWFRELYRQKVGGVLGDEMVLLY